MTTERMELILMAQNHQAAVMAGAVGGASSGGSGSGGMLKRLQILLFIAVSLLCLLPGNALAQYVTYGIYNFDDLPAASAPNKFTLMSGTQNTVGGVTNLGLYEGGQNRYSIISSTSPKQLFAPSVLASAGAPIDNGTGGFLSYGPWVAGNDATATCPRKLNQRIRALLPVGITNSGEGLGFRFRARRATNNPGIYQMCGVFVSVGYGTINGSPNLAAVRIVIGATDTNSYNAPRTTVVCTGWDATKRYVVEAKCEGSEPTITTVNVYEVAAATLAANVNLDAIDYTAQILRWSATKSYTSATIFGPSTTYPQMQLAGWVGFSRNWAVLTTASDQHAVMVEKAAFAEDDPGALSAPRVYLNTGSASNPLWNPKVSYPATSVPVGITINGGVPPYSVKWYGVQNRAATDFSAGQVLASATSSIGGNVTAAIDVSGWNEGDTAFIQARVTDSASTPAIVTSKGAWIERPARPYASVNPPIRSGYSNIYLVFLGDSITAAGMTNPSFVNTATDRVDPFDGNGSDGSYGQLRSYLTANGYTNATVKMAVFAWYGSQIGENWRNASPQYRAAAGTVAYADNAGFTAGTASVAGTQNIQREVLRRVAALQAANPSFKFIVTYSLGTNDMFSHDGSDSAALANVDIALSELNTAFSGMGCDVVLGATPSVGENHPYVASRYTAALDFLMKIREDEKSLVDPDVNRWQGDFTQFYFSEYWQKQYEFTNPAYPTAWFADLIHPFSGTSGGLGYNYTRTAQAQAMRQGVLAAPFALASANANGSTLTATLNYSHTGFTGYSVKVNGTNRPVTAVTKPSATTVSLTLGTPVALGDTITLSYVAGDVQDIIGRYLADFTNASVANGGQTDTISPVFANAAVSADGLSVVANFTEADSFPLLPTSPVGGFSVAVGGAARTITSITRTSGVQYTLNLAATIYQGQTPVTLSYTTGGGVTDSAAPSPNAMAAFSGAAVTNNSTVSSALTTPSVAFQNIGTSSLTVTLIGPAYGGTSPYSYRFQRAPDVSGSPGTFAFLTSLSSATSFTDTGLTPGTRYWYRAFGQDSASTPLTSFGAAFSALPGGSAGSGTGGLQWTDTVDGSITVAKWLYAVHAFLAPGKRVDSTITSNTQTSTYYQKDALTGALVYNLTYDTLNRCITLRPAVTIQNAPTLTGTMALTDTLYSGVTALKAMQEIYAKIGGQANKSGLSMNPRTYIYRRADATTTALSTTETRTGGAVNQVTTPGP